MFSNDTSETWESSEFQDYFIKNYFRKRMISKQEAKDALNPINNVRSYHSIIRDCEDVSQDVHVESEQKEYNLNKAKHTLNSQVNGNVKKKRKKSINSSQNCIINHENNDDCDKMKLDSSAANSNSLKSKKKRKRKPKKNRVVENQTALNSPKEIDNVKKLIFEEETGVISNCSSEKKSLFQNKLSQKLQVAKFRYLNELLYTNTGKDALVYFQENADEFQDYHKGYQSQVLKWPLNPVDVIIEEIHQMNKSNVIADLGCGEAKIAEAFPKRTVYSFDLIALKDCVTACDIANVPLPNESVDVVVFCLSLMGTNWKDYLREGRRILKLGGLLKIAEIESRIDNLNDFIKNIDAHGFSLVNKDVSHKMFIFLNFHKMKKKVKVSKIPNVTLKPCLYKKR